MIWNFSLSLTTVLEVLNTHIKHCFLVISAFMLPFCVTFSLVCVQLDHMPKDSLANFGSKSLSLFGG